MPNIRRTAVALRKLLGYYLSIGSALAAERAPAEG